MSRMVKVLAFITAGVIAAGLIFGFPGQNSGKEGGLIGEGAFRSKADINADKAYYFDDEAIALSDASGYNTLLRAEALEAAEEINDIREANGEDPLEWDMNLESVSSVRAEECSQSFSHTRPNGRAWNSVNSKIQGGENLAYGFDNSGDVVSAWMDSPTHADNILYSGFKRGAISIYVDDGGTMYWANEFGY